MEKRNTAPARVFAAIALVGGCRRGDRGDLSSLGGGDSTGSKRHGAAGRRPQDSGRPTAKTAATYVVKNGDTLTSIAHKTGVSVVRIQALNPEVDPQILIAGEKLKLR